MSYNNRYGFREAAIPVEVANQDGKFVREVQRINTEQAISRFIKAGGNLIDQFFPENLKIFERLFRRNSTEGMYDPSVSRNKPFVFELGSYKVPSNQTLLIFDIRPDIYRFSGLDAGDTLPVENRRFSSQVGWDIKTAERRVADLQYQLAPINIIGDEYQGYFNSNPNSNNLSKNEVNIANSQNFASVAGQGLALQPQRPDRYGAPNIPFTIIVNSSEVVTLTCTIFKPLTTPVAFFEYDIGGVLLPQAYAEYLVKVTAPPLPINK